MEILIDSAVVFSKNQQIETKRLVLRPVTMDDVLDMFTYAHDAETTEFVFPMHQTKSDTEISIAKYFMAAPLGKYGIALKESNRLIGTIDLRVDENAGTAEIGYVLNKVFWGNGYVPEAAEALLALGFEQLKLVRIFAFHDVRNQKSGRVLEKLGMKEEGHIPNARKWNGKVISYVLRGITNTEWETRSKLS
ncbi:MAG: GNAT family N-acetyltransferase [Enterococcus sp.]